MYSPHHLEALYIMRHNTFHHRQFQTVIWTTYKHTLFDLVDMWHPCFVFSDNKVNNSPLCSLNHIKKQCTISPFHYSTMNYSDYISGTFTQFLIVSQTKFQEKSKYDKSGKCRENEVIVDHSFTIFSSTACTILSFIKDGSTLFILCIFFKKSHLSPCHWIIHHFFSINSANQKVNFSWLINTP